LLVFSIILAEISFKPSFIFRNFLKLSSGFAIALYIITAFVVISVAIASKLLRINSLLMYIVFWSFVLFMLLFLIIAVNNVPVQQSTVMDF